MTAPPMDLNDTVVVVAEHRKGELSDITLEMLACGRRLADASHMQLHCILLTDDAAPFKALPLAADRLLIVESKPLGEFNPEAYIKVLTAVLKDVSPRVVILGNTSSGMDLAGSLSLAFGATVVGNVVSASWEDDKLAVVSTIYGGKIVASSEISAAAGIILLSVGNYPKAEGTRQQLPTVEVIPSPVALETLRVRFPEFIEREITGEDISKAPILVAVGRGIQSQETLAQVEELAKALGGSVCGTRPVVDQGWLPRSRQVGRSGMTVKPRLYLALGVSGAPEHVEGMKDADLVVAVNTDKSAPIFDVAQFGASVDLREVLPALIEKIKARRGG